MKKFSCYNTWEETYLFTYETEIEAESKEEAESKFEEMFCEVMNNNEEHFDKFSTELVGDTIPEINIKEQHG